MRNSKKRNQILEVFKSGHLLTANEVYEKVNFLDRSTVYRNLSLLTKEGILREVHIKKGISSYELSKEGDFHQHFMCDKCERISPIDIDPSKLKNILPQEVEFEEFELNLKGTCKSCK